MPTDIVALLTELLSRPYEEKIPGVSELQIFGDERGWVVVLAQSRSFWDDEDGSESRIAAGAMAEHEGGAIALLTAAWGPSTQVDISPLLAAGDPPPLAEMMVEWGAFAGATWVRGDRQVLVTTAQIDKEDPIQVLAVVGRPLT